MHADPFRPLERLRDKIAELNDPRIDAAIDTLTQLLDHVEDYSIDRVSRIHTARMIRAAIAQLGGSK